MLLAPTVNLHRSPLGGRHFECYSEDPLLTGEIGAGYVTGVQDQGVATTVKHFVANDFETERFTASAEVSERALRELYLAPFETIVCKAAAWGVMSAYNAVNGVSMTDNAWLQRGVLKDEWDFDGAIVSDWLAAREHRRRGQRRAGHRDARNGQPVGRAARRRRPRRGQCRPKLSMSRYAACCGWPPASGRCRGTGIGAAGAPAGRDRRRCPRARDRGALVRAGRQPAATAATGRFRTE